jgi:hypothetical protein
VRWLVDPGQVEIGRAVEFVAAEDCDPDAVLEHGDGQLFVAATEAHAQLGSDGAGRTADGDPVAGADMAAAVAQTVETFPIERRVHL